MSGINDGGSYALVAPSAAVVSGAAGINGLAGRADMAPVIDDGIGIIGGEVVAAASVSAARDCPESNAGEVIDPTVSLLLDIMTST